MTADMLEQLALSDRLRVAAGLIDDAAAGRTDRVQAMVRVLDILTLCMRSIAMELGRVAA